MSFSAFIEKRRLRIAKRVAKEKEDFDLSSFLSPHALSPRIETAPFPHIVIDDLFQQEVYRSIEQDFLMNLSRGLSQSPKDTERFHPFEIEYDGYLFVPKHYRLKRSPFSIFYSIAWNAFFSDLFRRDATFTTSMAFHHHPQGDSTGFIHHDHVDKYFSEKARLPTLVIPHDESEPKGPVPPGFFTERRVVALLFYLANPLWSEGSGGETALYAQDGETVCKKIAPVNNRLLAFSISKRSFHAFQANLLPRNCIVQWFHLPERLL